MMEIFAQVDKKRDSPTSPAMPTIFGGCGRNGRDLDFSAIITTVLEFLVGV